jgi:cystatin-A/B
MKCGGTTESRPASDDIQALCNGLKDELQSKVGKQFAEFTAIEYQTQVVAGTNYFIKIFIGNDEYVHARIFKPLPCNGTTLEVHSVQAAKTKDDQLAYF